MSSPESDKQNEKLILALPKGRILKEASPLLARAGIHPKAAFSDPDSRLLRFTTNHADLDIIRVRSFDVATFVAFGGMLPPTALALTAIALGVAVATTLLLLGARGFAAARI